MTGCDLRSNRRNICKEMFPQSNLGRSTCGTPFYKVASRGLVQCKVCRGLFLPISRAQGIPMSGTVGIAVKRVGHGTQVEQVVKRSHLKAGGKLRLGSTSN